MTSAKKFQNDYQDSVFDYHKHNPNYHSMALPMLPKLQLPQKDSHTHHRRGYHHKTSRQWHSQSWLSFHICLAISHHSIQFFRWSIHLWSSLCQPWRSSTTKSSKSTFLRNYVQCVSNLCYFSAFDLNLSHRLVHGNLSDSVTLDGSIKSLFVGWRGGIFNLSNSSVFPSICHLRAKLVDTKLHAFTSPARWDNSNQAFGGPDNLHLDHFGTFCIANGSLGKFLGRFSSLSIITAKLWNGFLCGFSHFSITKHGCHSNLDSIHTYEVPNTVN